MEPNPCPPLQRPLRYYLISLGCPKNLVDSERMAGLLQERGHQLVGQIESADLAVINTCGFIADARTESHDAIAEMVERKRRGLLRNVVVTGCLAQRDREALLAQYPEIDHVLGVFARDHIAAAVDRLSLPLVDQQAEFLPAPIRPLPDTQRLRLTPPHLAYLKISEGCNRTCSFCSIPLMRGPYASKPIEMVVEEARELVAGGAIELILVAQDTSFYGIDLYGRPSLSQLLDRLESIERLRWIRLMYLYPQHIDDRLVERLAACGKVLPYLDLPLQHINDDILAAMRRRVTRADTERLLDRLRTRIERLVLRTTMLVGFPGETERQFEELVQFVEQQRFQRLGVFAFCPEPGTPAAELDNPVPEPVKQERCRRLQEVQQKIAYAWSEAQVGQSCDVILDSPVPDNPDSFVGRSWADAPEIDGAVYVTGESLRAGQIVPCQIVMARQYDLIAIPLADAESPPDRPAITAQKPRKTRSPTARDQRKGANRRRSS